MGHPGAAQFATAALLLSHLHRKVMPSSWPALLLSCAEGFNAQPSTGRATRTFTCAGANAAGAGAATIFCLARRLRRGAARLALARAAPRRTRRGCARLRGARAGAARVLRCLPGNRRGESGAAAMGGRRRSPCRCNTASCKAGRGSAPAMSGVRLICGVKPVLFQERVSQTSCMRRSDGCRPGGGV